MSISEHKHMPEPVRRMEVFTGAGRRRSWSAADKVAIIAERYGAGETVCSVARRHGLTPQQLFTWRRLALQPDTEAAHQTWRHVADQLRGRWPKLSSLMDESEHDVLAYMTFPAQHRAKLHSTNPLERLNKEVKRRADVVGIFPNEASITRLIGAVLLEQNDEWLLQHRMATSNSTPIYTTLDGRDLASAECRWDQT